MPKKGIIGANNKTSLKKDTEKESVFNYLNKLKNDGKGATAEEICAHTGLPMTAVNRILSDLQSNKYLYGKSSYIVKRYGNIYKVVVYDSNQKIINGSNFESEYKDLICSIADTNGLNENYAIETNNAVILYPTDKRKRNQIKRLLSDSFQDKIKDIVPVERGLYIILSTDNKAIFDKTKKDLLKLYTYSA